MKSAIIACLVGALSLVGVAGAFASPERPTNNTDCYPDDPQPLGTASCSGVRPGAAIYRTQVGSGVSFRFGGACTLNFMFKGSDGHRYMGTAGHCLLEDGRENSNTEVSYKPGKGPKVFDAQDNPIGRYAYAINEEDKGTFEGGRDFALVRLDDGVAASPRMSYFGGPIAINNTRPSDVTMLHFFGHGLLVGDTQAGNQTTLPARSALAHGMPDRHLVHAVGIAVPGDSGSGVISADGRAVGVVVTGGLNSDPSRTGVDGSHSGLMGITRLTPVLQGAERFLGISLKLVTAEFTAVSQD